MQKSRCIVKVLALLFLFFFINGTTVSAYDIYLTGRTQEIFDQFSSSISESLDSLVHSFDNANSEWQSLTIESSHEISEEASNTASKAIAETGIEARCSLNLAEKNPTICKIIPDHIDANLDNNSSKRTKITIYGDKFGLFYDSMNGTTPEIEVRLTDNDNKYLLDDNKQEINIADQVLVKISNYELNLYLDVDSQFDQIKAISLVDAQGYEVAEIPVLHPSKSCETKIITVPASQINRINLIPANVISDWEFEGHGPEMYVNITLGKSYDENSIQALVTVSAVETRADWTQIYDYGQLFDIWYAPPGYKLKQISGQSWYSIHHYDTNKDDAIFYPGGLIDRVIIVGDVSGGDLGRTGVKEISFNSITVTLQQCPET